MSVVQQIADVLGISVSQLTGTTDTVGHARGGGVPEVEAVRAALTRHELHLGGCPPAVPELGVVERSVGHAWLCLARADYLRLLRALPDLITTIQWCAAGSRGSDPGGGEHQSVTVLVEQVYQIAAEVLRRLGVLDVAWLAADRAVLASADSGDVWWAARAAIPLADVLRDMGQPRHGFELCVTTAHRLAGVNPLDGPPGYLSVYGTLLLHAALSAAGLGDEISTADLLDQAETVAEAVGPGHDYYRTCFGPALVAITRVATAVELGCGQKILADVSRLAADPDFHRLPAAIRAAYLIDVARAHLQDADPITAGRALLAADRTAEGEVRARPAARDVLAAVLRASPRAEPAVTQLAETLNLTI